MKLTTILLVAVLNELSVLRCAASDEGVNNPLDDTDGLPVAAPDNRGLRQRKSWVRDARSELRGLSTSAKLDLLEGLTEVFVKSLTDKSFGFHVAHGLESEIMKCESVPANHGKFVTKNIWIEFGYIGFLANEKETPTSMTDSQNCKDFRNMELGLGVLTKIRVQNITEYKNRYVRKLDMTRTATANVDLGIQFLYTNDGVLNVTENMSSIVLTLENQKYGKGNCDVLEPRKKAYYDSVSGTISNSIIGRLQDVGGFLSVRGNQ